MQTSHQDPAQTCSLQQEQGSDDLVDEQSVGAAYLQHRDELARYAMSIVKSEQAADDVVQDVFVKLMRQKKQVLEHVTQWLFVVTKNTAIKKLKVLQRYVYDGALLDSTEKSPMKMHPSPLMLTIHNERREMNNAMLAEAIEKLPEAQRACIKLRFFGELSYNDIAKARNSTSAAVGFNINHAMKKLNKLVKEYNNVR